MSERVVRDTRTGVYYIYDRGLHYWLSAAAIDDEGVATFVGRIWTRDLTERLAFDTKTQAAVHLAALVAWRGEA